VVRYSLLRGTPLMPGGYAVIPERYAVRFWGVRYFFPDGTPLMKPPIGQTFMDSTLFVARAQDHFSEGHTIYFWVRGAPIVAPTSHPWRTHLPSIRQALLHQRYAISAAYVRLPLLAHIHERRGETAWKIAEGVSSALLWRQEATDRDSFDPSWPLSEPDSGPISNLQTVSLRGSQKPD
jgi:hypothetical protein